MWVCESLRTACDPAYESVVQPFDTKKGEHFAPLFFSFSSILTPEKILVDALDERFWLGKADIRFSAVDVNGGGSTHPGLSSLRHIRVHLGFIGAAVEGGFELLHIHSHDLCVAFQFDPLEGFLIVEEDVVISPEISLFPSGKRCFCGERCFFVEAERKMLEHDSEITSIYVFQWL